MNQVQKYNQIDENQLNQGEFFQSLFLQLCEKQLLTQAQIEKIQIELIELLGKEVERYTNGESSSVPVEKAQDLLHSITYSIGLFLKSNKDMDLVMDLLTNGTMISLFHKGMEVAIELKEKAAILLENLQKDIMDIDNYAYQDTIREGISGFFQEYDVEFGAFQTPGSVDYPLLEWITDLQGVEYTYEYLYRLTLENNFLKCFDDKNIAILLTNFHHGSEHMLINLFEIVLTNAIGCALSGRQILMLDIPVEEQLWLKNHMIGKPKEEIREQLIQSIDQIGKELGLSNELITYARKAVSEMTSRIVHHIENDTLQELFITFQHNLCQEDIFEDGISMEDEDLRKLIDEIGEISNVSDKLIKIRDNVRSLSDFIELLQICFYGSDYKEVFEMLSGTDRALLIHYMKEEAGPEWTYDYKPDIEWQKNFIEWYKEKQEI